MLLMQFDALFMAPETALPRARRGERNRPRRRSPGSAHIRRPKRPIGPSAYERRSSFQSFLPQAPVPPRGYGFHAARGRRNYAELTRPRTRWNRVKRPVTVAPRALSCPRAATQLTYCQPKFFDLRQPSLTNLLSCNLLKIHKMIVSLNRHNINFQFVPFSYSMSPRRHKNPQRNSRNFVTILRRKANREGDPISGTPAPSARRGRIERRWRGL